MKNNYFVIATGRSYYDFKKKEDLYGIKYNYLIINLNSLVTKYNSLADGEKETHDMSNTLKIAVEALKRLIAVEKENTKY